MSLKSKLIPVFDSYKVQHNRKPLLMGDVHMSIDIETGTPMDWEQFRAAYENMIICSEFENFLSLLGIQSAKPIKIMMIGDEVDKGIK